MTNKSVHFIAYIMKTSMETLVLILIPILSPLFTISHHLSVCERPLFLTLLISSIDVRGGASVCSQPIKLHDWLQTLAQCRLGC